MRLLGISPSSVTLLCVLYWFYTSLFALWSWRELWHFDMVNRGIFAWCRTAFISHCSNELLTVKVQLIELRSCCTEWAVVAVIVLSQMQFGWKYTWHKRAMWTWCWLLSYSMLVAKIDCVLLACRFDMFSVILVSTICVCSVLYASLSRVGILCRFVCFVCEFISSWNNV